MASLHLFPFVFLSLTSTSAYSDLPISTIISEGFTLPTFIPPVPIHPSVLPITPENCTVLLEKFSNASARFTHCANKFAKPISMCLNCKEDYLNVTEFFKKLSQTNQDGVICKNILTSVDRVEIIEATIKFIACPTTGLWARASCNNCYNLPLNVSSTINHRAKQFFDIRQNVTQCFSKHPVNFTGMRSEACDECWPVYKSLSEFFKWNIQHRSDSSITGICFDVIDAMNITQRVWGKDYRCIRNQQTNPILITAVSLILCTPIAFYVLVRICATGTRERVVAAPNIADLLQQAARYVNRGSSRQNIFIRENSRQSMFSSASGASGDRVGGGNVRRTSGDSSEREEEIAQRE